MLKPKAPILRALLTAILTATLTATLTSHTATAQPPQDQQRIAVVELKNGAELRAREIQLLTSITRGVLAERLGDTYLVMTRENILSLMDEKTCNEAQSKICEVEIGRRLGAHLIVSGAVTRRSGALLISLRAHSTQDARLLSVREGEAQTIEPLLGLAKGVAEELSRALYELNVEEPPAAQAPATRAPATRAPAAQAPAAPPRELSREERAGVEWVHVPGGEFEMGKLYFKPKYRRVPDYILPVHTVRLRDYLISQTEVTVGQYRECVKDGVCSKPSCDSSYMSANWTDQPGSNENQPINCVTWPQARTFAKWLGADLPTEAEWEYAARGGERFTHSGSNDPEAVGWYETNESKKEPRVKRVKPVKLKRPNGYGLYDMSGNLYEWTLDEYQRDYEGAPSDGHQAVGSIPQCKKICESVDRWRVIRGGSWNHPPDYHLGVVERAHSEPDHVSDTLGFRVRKAHL